MTELKSSLVTHGMVTAAIEAAWLGSEIVYSDGYDSAEAMMRAALEAAIGERRPPSIEQIENIITDYYDDDDSVRSRGCAEHIASALSCQASISAIYSGLTPGDVAAIDREWARLRGYILPTDGTNRLVAMAT